MIILKAVKVSLPPFMSAKDKYATKGKDVNDTMDPKIPPKNENKADELGWSSKPSTS